jgi:alcohol dehydrogenase (cytochrome c)
MAWSFEELFPLWSGALSTAAGVAFYGTLDGYLKALDVKTGRELYRYRTGAGIVGDVISYEIKGKQYIAVLSGPGGLVGVGLSDLSRSNEGLRITEGSNSGLGRFTALGGELTVFRLPD